MWIGIRCWIVEIRGRDGRPLNVGDYLTLKLALVGAGDWVQQMVSNPLSVEGRANMRDGWARAHDAAGRTQTAGEAPSDTIARR